MMVFFEEMKRVTKKVQALEKKAQLYLGGATKVAGTKEKEIHSLYQKIDEATTELNCFKKMAELEENAIPLRVLYLKTQLESQRDQEKDLQTRFAALLQERESLPQISQSA